jgi:hypothetical protein
MTAREQAEELRQEAIKTLIEEKKAIDGMLRTLGYEESALPEKRRGRRPKQDGLASIQEAGELSDLGTPPATVQMEP